TTWPPAWPPTASRRTTSSSSPSTSPRTTASCPASPWTRAPRSRCSPTGRRRRPRARTRGLLSPPQGSLVQAEPLRRLEDLFEEAGGVAGVARRRLQAGHLLLPEAVELQHQQLAQVLADHRRQGHAEMLRVGA